jgi:hypothetical protein
VKSLPLFPKSQLFVGKLKINDHLIENAGVFTDNGTTKARFRKTGVMML